MAKKDNEVTLQIRRSFTAPREKVFQAWTQAEHLKKWFAPSAEHITQAVELDLRVGGKYRISILAPDGAMHTISGMYREIKPPEKLVYTWGWEEKTEIANTLVSVEFIDQGEETQILLTHELFPNEKARDDHNKGWSGCLDSLAQKVEQGAF